MQNEIYILFILVGLILILLIKIYIINYEIKDVKNFTIINENLSSNEFLIELVNNNDPQFIILFMGHYPCFLKKMQKLNPNISNNELTFLAFCYLDLNTKKISENTFVSEGAVAMRKNRIRKKYNIDSSIPFNKWIQDYVNN